MGILATLGAVSVAQASVAPGMIGATNAPTPVTEVRMNGMHGHKMGHHRSHMMRHGHGHRHHRM